MTLPARVATVMITGYQLLISPWLPRACRFAPTCSEYARLAMVERGAARGAWLAMIRIFKCHPLHPGGYDPPPIARRRA